MNRSIKTIIVGLCILSVGQSLYSVDGIRLLNEYSLRAQRYAKYRAGTEDGLLTLIGLGATAGAAAFLKHYSHMSLVEALITASSTGGVAAIACALSSKLFVRPLARYLNTEHSFPLSVSSTRSRKLEPVAELERSLSTNDPIDPIRLKNNPSFAHDEYIQKLLSKLEAKAGTAHSQQNPIRELESIGGGYEPELLEVVLHITAPELSRELGQQNNPQPQSDRSNCPDQIGILLEGQPGTGKTLKSAQIAALARVAHKEINVGELKQPYHGESEENVRGMFEEARQKITDLISNMSSEEKAIHAKAQKHIAIWALFSLKISDRREEASRIVQADQRDRLNGVLVDAERRLHGLDTSNISEEAYNTRVIALSQLVCTGLDTTNTGHFLQKIRTFLARPPVYHPSCVLFIDEIDAFGSRTETHDGGASVANGMITQLLGELDGADKTKNKGIVVIAATNRADLLDPAIRRAGRFDKELRINIPADAPERISYLEFFGGKNARIENNIQLEPPIQGKYNVAEADRTPQHYQEIAARTDNFSQAELDSIFKTAKGYAARDLSNVITWHHLERALHYVKAKKGEEVARNQAQRVQQESASNLPVSGDRRLAHLEYWGGHDDIDGVYPVEREARGHFRDIAQNNIYFTPNNIRAIFEAAVGLKLQRHQDGERISWADIQTVFLGVRTQRLHSALLPRTDIEQQLQQQQQQQQQPEATLAATTQGHPPAAATAETAQVNPPAQPQGNTIIVASVQATAQNSTVIAAQALQHSPESSANATPQNSAPIQQTIAAGAPEQLQMTLQDAQPHGIRAEQPEAHDAEVPQPATGQHVAESAVASPEQHQQAEQPAPHEATPESVVIHNAETQQHQPAEQSTPPSWWRRLVNFVFA